jgi:hypothetical protein
MFIRKSPNRIGLQKVEENSANKSCEKTRKTELISPVLETKLEPFALSAATCAGRRLSGAIGL